MSAADSDSPLDSTANAVGSDDLVRLAAEFQTWAKSTRSEFAARHPKPRIPIYTPQIHPRREREWNREWGDWLWPHAVKWWAERGYALQGKSGQWYVKPNDKLRDGSGSGQPENQNQDPSNE